MHRKTGGFINTIANRKAQSIASNHQLSPQRNFSQETNPNPNPKMEGDSFQFSIGPPNSGFSMFMADRTKKVHFIR
jgi:hypothetical protein